jgi:hypothetical protein
MKGGKYLAEMRGAFEQAPEQASVMTVEDVVELARAPLYAFAATHDGQPPLPWLERFVSMFRHQEPA